MEYTLIFDGGAKPSGCYGSYRIILDGTTVKHKRFDLPDAWTNNTAEYGALIEGLKALLALVGDEAENCKVQIWGDTLLVLNQVGGFWKVRTPHLLPFREEAVKLLSKFGAVTTKWVGRDKIMSYLGH